MSNKNQNIYQTDNFSLASYLVADGCELQGIEPYPNNGNKYIFCFFNTNRLQSLVEDYFSLKATVNPQDFSNAQKNLKAVIYARKSSEGGGF